MNLKFADIANKNKFFILNMYFHKNTKLIDGDPTLHRLHNI